MHIILDPWHPLSLTYSLPSSSPATPAVLLPFLSLKNGSTSSIMAHCPSSFPGYQPILSLHLREAFPEHPTVCMHTHTHTESPLILFPTSHFSSAGRSLSAKQTLPSQRSSLVWKISLAFCAACQYVKWFLAHADAQSLLTA